MVLSSFFWGYILPQIAAGWLANTYGPKWFLVSAMFICSAAGILLPSFAAYFGSRGVMAIRSIQGLSQGFIFPSVHSLLSNWVPPNERSRLGTFVYAGKLSIELTTKFTRFCMLNLHILRFFVFLYIAKGKFLLFYWSH